MIGVTAVKNTEDLLMKHEPDPIILYVNTGYGNEVTLGGTMDHDIDSFGDVTWREFIEDIQLEDLSDYENQLDEWLEEEYRISASQLDERLDSSAVDRYYDKLAFHQDNFSGSNSQAFNLIRTLDLFPMDKDGNGSAHGVQLDQSTANGPRQTAWIADQEAADWLMEQAAKRGVALKVVFN